MLQSILWNGQRLAIELDAHTEDRRVVLALDGLFFSERIVPAQQRQVHFDFPFAPQAGGEFGISLRLEPQGIELLPRPWYVRFGEAASHAMPASVAHETSVVAVAQQDLAPLLDATIFSPLQQPDALHVPVTIIVPIYNASELVQRCIEALIEHTQGPAQLLLIDDASTDAAIAPLLARYQNSPGITVLSNTHNVGYTHNIALGLSHAPQGDVVVLNADTEVGPNWLLGLRRAAYARADIGTATAVSDNAGAFSVPELERHNPLPTAWSLMQTQRALWQQAGLLTPALPTGNGFCMYVKRAMLDQVGGPDVDAFPQGYGEENDWCQRAEHTGFSHVIAGNVLVRHARSASFGEARRESLGQTGMAVLRERYPHYEAAVGATLFSFERRVLDWRVRHIYRSALNATTPLRPRVLRIVALPSEVGGDDADALIAFARDFDIWKLECRQQTILLMQYSVGGWREIQRASIAPCLEFAPATWLRYDEIFAGWVQHYAIDLVHLIDSRGHSGHLLALSQSLGVPLLDTRDAPALSCEAMSITHQYNTTLNSRRCFASAMSQG
ncbi:glycosyltransferase family 2 protein [Pseudolysobacter antarcticus]|nr:glycosyltransferase [Pseudolysobacter antarcticus]